MPISKFSVDIVKGWTRATCVVFIMLAVTELDPSEESTKALVKPLERVLDKAWLLPMHAPGPEYVVWGVLRAGWKGSNYNIFLVRGSPMVRVCAIVSVLRWLSV